MDLVQLQSEVHDVYTFDAFQAAVFNEYKDLREGHLGNFTVVYKMRLDLNSTPVVRPPRKVPLAMEECIKRELERMVKIGVITPVSEPTISNQLSANNCTISNQLLIIWIDPKRY